MARQSQPTRPFAGLTSAEAARRKAERGRERKAEREALAELDKVTVDQRRRAVLSKVVTTEPLITVWQAVLNEAEAGKAWACKLVVEATTPESDAEPDPSASYRKMTPQQRATARARLLAMLAKPIPDAVPSAMDETGVSSADADGRPPHPRSG